MNKVYHRNGLAKIVYRKTGVPLRHCEIVVKAFLEELGFALTRAEKIELRGFGVFRVRKRRAKSVANFHTGERLVKPKCKAVTFRPYAWLSDLVNGDTGHDGKQWAVASGRRNGGVQGKDCGPKRTPRKPLRKARDNSG